MRLDELAERLGATLDGDGSISLTGAAPIEHAGPGQLTFVVNPRYRSRLATTRASAVVLGHDEDACGHAALRADDPYRTFARALALFDDRPRPQPGVDSTAVISSSAQLGKGAYVGAHAVVGDDVVIGRDARIHPHVTIYPDVRIGDRFTAHAGVVVRECVTIGDDVVLQPGVVVGGDGFGYLPRPGESAEAIPQIGSVTIGNGVEIGANTTVDRAAVGATVIEDGVKLDNLVMVAHGCRVGERSLLAAQTGMAGSTIIGKDVMTGGQVGFAGHAEIGDGVRIAAQSGVAGDLAAGQTVAGSPAVDIRIWRRYVTALTRLPELLRRVRVLERSAPDHSKGEE